MFAVAEQGRRGLQVGRGLRRRGGIHAHRPVKRTSRALARYSRSQILVILHVRDAGLLRAYVLRIQQRLSAGGPHVLRAEAEFALPWQPHADPEVDAGPALHPIPGRTRQRGLQHPPHDRTTDASVLDSETERGLVQIIGYRRAGTGQEMDTTLACTQIQLRTREYAYLAMCIDAGAGAVGKQQRLGYGSTTTRRQDARQAGRGMRAFGSRAFGSQLPHRKVELEAVVRITGPHFSALRGNQRLVVEADRIGGARLSGLAWLVSKPFALGDSCACIDAGRNVEPQSRVGLGHARLQRRRARGRYCGRRGLAVGEYAERLAVRALPQRLPVRLV